MKAGVAILLFSLVLLCRSPTAAKKVDFTKVKEGLDSGKKLLGKIKENNFVETTKNVAKWGVPLISSIGSFFKVLMLEFGGESKELAFMKKEFKALNDKMDSLDEEFIEVKRLIDWTTVKVSYASYERSIDVMQDKLMDILKANPEVLPIIKDQFIMLYEQDYHDATRKLYEGLINKQMIFSDNLIAAIRKYTANHRGQVREFLLGVLKLIVKGVEVDTAYLSMTNKNMDKAYWTKLWEERLTRLEKVYMTVDNEIARNWHDQLSTDLETFSAKNYGVSNSDYSLSLYNYLGEKYPERAWFVLIYNPLAGDTPHYVFTCGGYIRFRQRGKNVVVGSAPLNRRTFDPIKAAAILNSLPTKMLSWGSGPAKTLLNRILGKTGQSCTEYSMAAVVEWGGGVWYVSSQYRRAYKKWEGYYNRFIDIRKDYNLLLFG